MAVPITGSENAEDIAFTFMGIFVLKLTQTRTPQDAQVQISEHI
jgi:hypothetical protein